MGKWTCFNSVYLTYSWTFPFFSVCSCYCWQRSLKVPHPFQVFTVCVFSVSLSLSLSLSLLKSTSPTDTDYKTLCILPLKLRFEHNKGIFMYKIMFEIAPPYLKQLFQVSRSRGLNKITIMIPRIDLFKSSLTYSGAVLWNSLPEPLKKPISTSSFKSRFLTHLSAKVCSNL